MNMKTLAVLVLMGLGLSAFAADQIRDQNGNTYQQVNNQQGRAKEYKVSPVCAKMIAAGTDATAKAAALGGIVTEQECNGYKVLTSSGESLGPGTVETKSSMDGLINCQRLESYTKDYEACADAVSSYHYVLNAETALGVVQQFQTNSKNQSIQSSTTKQVAAGNGQTAMFDASIAGDEHQKQMQAQQAAAYGMAVAALGNAYRNIPTKTEVLQLCGSSKDCQNVVANRSSVILANQSARDALQAAIINFTAKGVAAGIKMNQYGQRAQQVAAAKNYVQDTSEDAMVERCVFNPTDPACAISSTPVTGSSYTGGSFSIGDGAGNAFTSTPDAVTSSETPISDYNGGDTVSGVNSPFEDQAQIAKGIVDPAPAAQAQASGGAGSGGGGGAGGGGGGSASLGSDLQGADKNGDKEAQIKTNKVSGSYSSSGGSGFAAVKGGKDSANPFASLFDSKTAGGLEEDRSIASGDIDGAGSGLFQKISKRYGQVQADKRIEASNLE